MRLQVHILLPFVPPSEAKKLHVLFNMCERPLLIYLRLTHLVPLLMRSRNFQLPRIMLEQQEKAR